MLFHITMILSDMKSKSQNIIKMSLNIVAVFRDIYPVSGTILKKADDTAFMFCDLTTMSCNISAVSCNTSSMSCDTASMSNSFLRKF